MIQRLQSVFLLLAGISSFLILFFDFGQAFDKTEGWEIIGFGTPDSPVLKTLAILIALISVGSIFLFKHRKLQVGVISLNIVIAITLCVLVYLLKPKLGALLKNQVDEKMGYAFLFVGLMIFFSLLAIFFIRKDEKLVKSTDRFR